MRIGIQLEVVRDGSREPMGEAYEQYRRFVALARDAGFHGLFHGQWFVRSSVTSLQPMPLLASVAEEAAPMTIGSGILLLPLLHPIEVAEQAATIDVISNGRFILGVGSGYGEEFDHFGVDLKSRGKRLEESVEVIKRLWTQTEVTFEGDHFPMKGVTPMLAPVQSPRPEIWIAASADVAVKRAARIADACFIGPHVTLQTVARQIELFNETRAGIEGLGPATCMPLMREVFIAETREKAQRLAAPFLERSYRELYVEHGQDKVMPDGEENFDQPFEQLAKDRFIIGDLDDYRAEVERYREIGVDYLVLHLPYFGIPEEDIADGIRLLGEATR